MSDESKDNLPRWATAIAAWIIVLLIGVCGKIFWDDRLAVLDNQRKLTELIHNHDVRIAILESLRDGSGGNTGRNPYNPR